MKSFGEPLTIENLSFCRGDSCILHNISMELKAGEMGGLVGPSGAGKSTLLRVVAGLETPSDGKVSLGGKCLTSEKILVPAENRKVGMLFQDFALLPHLNVRANIEFGLFKWKKAEKTAQVEKIAALLGLTELLDRSVFELSGGQQQRVALARVLATEPALLLLDEPFSQLDPEWRQELIAALRKALRQTQTTALLVTHHQEDAYDLCDKFGVLNDTHLVQWGTPFELYHKPRTRFVADFVGEGAFIKAKVEETACGPMVKSGLGSFPLPHGVHGKGPFELLVRPDDVHHVDSAGLKAEIVDRRFRGSTHLYTLKLLNGEQVYSLVHSHHDHKIGEMIGIEADLEHLNIFEEEKCCG